MSEKRPTALITGASSGIGAVFAREFAARGYDLIIAARRTDRLDELAAEITASTGAAVKVVASDLSAQRCRQTREGGWVDSRRRPGQQRGVGKHRAVLGRGPVLDGG